VQQRHFEWQKGEDYVRLNLSYYDDAQRVAEVYLLSINSYPTPLQRAEKQVGIGDEATKISFGDGTGVLIYRKGNTVGIVTAKNPELAYFFARDLATIDN
jgi:hypothetical protein